MTDSFEPCGGPGGDVDQELEALLQKARGGDRQALNELLGRYRERLSAVIRNALPQTVRAKEGVSDVTQDCLVEVLEHLGQFKGRTLAEFTGWIRTIARNGALKAARYWARECRDVRQEAELAEGSAPGVCPVDPGSSPSSRAARHERADHLHQALARLRPDDQEVIRLRDFEALAWEEVARRMGREVEAVKKLGARAIARLAKELSSRQDAEASDE